MSIISLNQVMQEAESQSLVKSSHIDSLCYHHLLGNNYYYSSSTDYYIGTIYGSGSSASGSYSFAGGVEANSSLYSQFSLASGKFTSSGDAQYSSIILRAETTDNSETSMSIKGNPELLQIPLASGYAYKINIDCVAVQYTGSAGTIGDAKAWEMKLLAKNIGGTSDIVGVPTTVVISENSGSSNWELSSSVDNSNDKLNLVVTGETNKSIKWVSNVNWVQVGY